LGETATMLSQFGYKLQIQAQMIPNFIEASLALMPFPVACHWRKFAISTVRDKIAFKVKNAFYE